MSSKQQLVFAIVKFLEEECSSGDLDPDSVEGLEVSKQCLEQAYAIDVSTIPPLPATLLDIFLSGLQKYPQGAVPKATKTADDSVRASSTSDEDKAAAERFKSEGNDLMKQERFEDALQSYTRAIESDPNNAVYYCNRAAAYGKLNKHRESLEDCNAALRLDPQYSKAYGRQGLAHTALEQHREAVTSYQQALQLDPQNQSYRTNLEIAQQKIPQSTTPPNMGGLNLGGMDFGALLNNPQLMNMATQMMSNPQMQHMMASFMGGGTGGPDGGQAPDMSSLLTAGQQLAQQMQESNPDLVDQLRTQYRQDRSQDDGQPPSSQQPDQSQSGGNGDS